MTVQAPFIYQKKQLSNLTVCKTALKGLSQIALKKCNVENITDPIEILRCASTHIVQGRPLDVSSASETVEGETNFIHVDRQDILQSAFEEISSLENLRLTLEVSFYGELASDLGGPRREFFMLCLREIQSKYFDNGLRDYMSNDYEIVGLIIGLSMLQNGRVPHFMTEDIINQTFLSEAPSACMYCKTSSSVCQSWDFSDWKKYTSIPRYIS